MIVLDTNVISEIAKPVPSEQAVAWLTRQPPEELCTTTITEAELFAGVMSLPDGRRKTEMARAYDEILLSFVGGIHSFDRRAAREYASVFAQRRSAGLKTDTADGLIAAIARAYGAAVATRNVAHYTHTGIAIINPWTA